MPSPKRHRSNPPRRSTYLSQLRLINIYDPILPRTPLDSRQLTFTLFAFTREASKEELEQVDDKDPKQVNEMEPKQVDEEPKVDSELTKQIVGQLRQKPYNRVAAYLAAHDASLSIPILKH